MKKNHALIILHVLFCLTAFRVSAQKVMVLKIREEIDPRMAHYVELGLKAASEQKADYILIDMDTYGGALTDADKIRTLLLDYQKPVYVYINKNAASAGALISIACDSIYMAGGSNIGSATVVDGEGKPAPDKYQSYMRSMMRATAETNKRNPDIAASMVGSVVGADSMTVGKVTAFTTSEAIANGYCEAQLSSLEEVLKRVGLPKATLVPFALSTTDTVINFFMNPILRGLLLMLIIGGIYFELQSPGIGFPLAAAATGIVLYFLPSYLNGLAENWEILLFIIGVILLIVEIAFIPGFGVIGLVGLVLMVCSLVLVALNNTAFDFTFVRESDIILSASVVLFAFTAGIAMVFVAGNQFMKSKLFQRMTLQDTFQSSEGYTSNFNSLNLTGKQGISYTVLRPSGKVQIDGIMYDASTRGEYIEANTPVEVIDHLSTSLKVKAIHV